MKKISQSLKVNILFIVIVASLITAALLVNGIALRLSVRYDLDVDLTAGALYEIGSDTKAFLASLDVPVQIYVLSDEGGFSGDRYLIQAKRIIDQYPRFSGNITLEYVDYATNPLFAVNYPELALAHGDIIVQGTESYRHIPGVNLFNFSMQHDGGLSIISSRAEEALTSAIVNVIGGEMPKIALLTGNGTSGASLFASLLVDNNFEVLPVSLANAELSEFDAALLSLPTIDLSESAIRSIEAFLYNDGLYGKTLLYTAGAAQGALPNLDMFLSEWGVRFSDGAVFETSAERTYQFQPYYPTVSYADGRYFDMLRDRSMPFLMPLARPMELLFTVGDGYFVETLLYFSDTSGVRPADAGEDFTAEHATIRGPLPALVVSGFHAAAPDGTQQRSTIIVSSSTGIFETIALQNTSLNNAEFLLNLLGDLIDRDDIINIHPTSLEGRTLGITSSQASTLGVILVGIIPLAILLTGVAVWLVRRFK